MGQQNSVEMNESMLRNIHYTWNPKHESWVNEEWSNPDDPDNPDIWVNECIVCGEPWSSENLPVCLPCPSTKKLNLANRHCGVCRQCIITMNDRTVQDKSYITIDSD